MVVPNFGALCLHVIKWRACDVIAVKWINQQLIIPVGVAPKSPLPYNTYMAERSGTRRRRLTASLLGPSFVAGVAMLILGEVESLVSLQVRGLSVGHFLGSLGEAFVIAALLGFLVDRKLKAELGHEIAERTSHATAEVFFRELLGGRNMPTEYYEGMSRAALTDILSLGATWEVELDWTDDHKYVRARTTLRNVLHNVSSASVRMPLPWVLSYEDGRPSAYLERYEYSINLPATDSSSADQVQHFSFTPQQLSRVNHEIADDSAQPNRYAVGVDIAPKARFDYVATSVTFHCGSGVLPLFSRYPTLKREVQLGGSALGQMRAIIFSPGTAPTIASPSQGSTPMEFKSGQFVAGGSTVIVQWSLLQDVDKTSVGASSSPPG